jgi:hypothetical protein
MEEWLYLFFVLLIVVRVFVVPCLRSPKRAFEEPGSVTVSRLFSSSKKSEVIAEYHALMRRVSKPGPNVHGDGAGLQVDGSRQRC